jgi:hypothetical protein
MQVQKILFSLLFLFSATVLRAQLPPIQLLSTYVDTASGQPVTHVIQWEVAGGTVSSNVGTNYYTFLAGSSFFDAYAGQYYFRGSSTATSQLVKMNTDSLNFQELANSEVLRASTEVDMQNGRIWGISTVTGSDYSLVEYQEADSSISVVGTILEATTSFVDANCYSSNDAMFYFMALDDSSRLSLFSVSTDSGNFAYNRVDISGIALPLATNLEYDNERDKIYALYTMQSPMGGAARAQIAELDPITGVATLLLDMPQYNFFQMSSQTFDQATGSLVFIGIDANLTYSLNIYNTITNTLVVGTLPVGILPFNLECDNTAFARAKYGTLASVSRPVPAAKLGLYPVPASTTLHLGATEPAVALILSDLQGRMVQVPFDGATQTLQVEGLAPGMYVIKAIGERGNSLGTERFVKE